MESQMVHRSMGYYIYKPIPGSQERLDSDDTCEEKTVHMIPVDLWKQASGENLTPSKICELQDLMYSKCLALWIPFPNISDKYGIFVSMAKDKNECRVLQQQLEEGSEDFRNKVFLALLPKFSELIYDNSANYVYQKLCEVTQPYQNEILKAHFRSDLFKIIDHSNGCRVLQKYIECASPLIVDRLYCDLKEKLLVLCRSLNGNHIIRRFIESLPDRRAEIIAILRPHVLSLVVDNCGCRVVQKLFEQCKGESLSLLDGLIEPLIERSVELSTNQYGNYVIQIILESENREYVDRLITMFSKHFYRFSIHKFASNVIESCIWAATEEQKFKIFDEIIGEKGVERSRRIKDMACDQFGNYVIQRIIDQGNDYQRGEIFDVICENYDELHSVPYAKHVISCMQSASYY